MWVGMQDQQQRVTEQEQQDDVRLREHSPAMWSQHEAADAAFARALLETEQSDRPTVIVQGIEVPLSTPALWLCQQLPAADTMLYVCVRPALGINPAAA